MAKAKTKPKSTTKAKQPAAIPSNPALEAVIASDPRDSHAWSVLEDWILETDDPRAAIVLAERKAPPPKRSWDRDADVERAYDKLRKRLLGEHPKWVLMKNRVRGSRWRAGHTTRLGVGIDTDKHDAALERELFAAILEAPATRLVYETTVSVRPLIGPFLDLLASSRAVRSLRRMMIGPYDERNGPMEIDGNLLAPFQIAELSCSYSTILRAAPPLARLRSLALDSKTHAENAKLFAAMTFPELRSLKLRTMHITPSDLAPLLDSTATPKLDTLLLHDGYNDIAAALVDVLRSSKLLRQLKTLELGWELGKVSPEPQSERIVPGASLGTEFAHLEILTVPRDY